MHGRSATRDCRQVHQYKILTFSALRGIWRPASGVPLETASSGMVREGAGIRLQAVAGRLLRLRLMLAMLAVAAYCLAFPSLAHAFGPGAPVMAALPVGLLAWALGARAGLLAGLAAVALNALLARLADPHASLVMTQVGGLPGSLVVVLAGLVIGRLRDVDVRRRAELDERMGTEQALRESEARKGAILEASADCIVAMDVDGCILEFNTTAERTFGFRRGYAVGRPMVDLIIPSRDRAAHREAIRAMMKI